MGEKENGNVRPMLLVLSVDTGSAFPSASQGSTLKVTTSVSYFLMVFVQVKARLDEDWLESGEVPASSNPHFGTELAWEVRFGACPKYI